MIKLTTPISEASIRALKVGTTMLITGNLFTGRDAALRATQLGIKPPA